MREELFNSRIKKKGHNPCHEEKVWGRTMEGNGYKAAGKGKTEKQHPTKVRAKNSAELKKERVRTRSGRKVEKKGGVAL